MISWDDALDMISGANDKGLFSSYLDGKKEGAENAYNAKVRNRSLADLDRADMARTAQGQALAGDGMAMSRLAQLDPSGYMATQNYQQGQVKAKREATDADKERIASAVYHANTPELYSRVMQRFKREGFDIDDDDMDFKNRAIIIGEAQGIKGATQADQFDRGYDVDRMNAETSRMNAATKVEPDGFTLPPGSSRYSGNGQLLATAAPRPVQPRALTSVDKNAILEADDQVQSGQSAIGLLNEALGLNDKAGSGALAGTQAFLARNDPTGFLDDEKGAATTDFNNIIAGQALQSMKSIFGGNPTEGERAILLQLQGMADKSPQERSEIIKRGIALAQRRTEFNKQRASEIRDGSYFGGASTVEQGSRYPGADGITSADQGGGFTQQKDIPQGAAEDLASDPSPQARREFDEIFGAGASIYVLGQ